MFAVSLKTNPFHPLNPGSRPSRARVSPLPNPPVPLTERRFVQVGVPVELGKYMRQVELLEIVEQEVKTPHVVRLVLPLDPSQLAGERNVTSLNRIMTS